MNKTSLLKAMALSLLATAALSGQAATTWQFSGTGSNDANGEPLAKTSYTSASEGTLAISGAYAVNASNVASGKWLAPAPGANTLYFGGGGLGMCSDPNNTTNVSSTNPACTQPNHALDNNGNTEAILLQFSQSVVLTSIGIGYRNGDADLTLFRYTGTGTPPAITGSDASQGGMQTAGWQLVGNYADLAQDTTSPYTAVNGATSTGVNGSTPAVTASSVGSSWWLISAYNSGLGGTASKNGGALSNGDDYFKIFGVTTTVCSGSGASDCGKKLPEPASLALASVALLGVAGLRRRRDKLAA